MKLNILGTGTFFANIDQTASAYVLTINNKKILIDCGPGTLVRLSQAGIKPADLDYIFITHFHPDHTSDLFPLFMNYRLTDTFSPGEITKFPSFYGPEGIDKYMSDYAKNSELLSYDNWDKVQVKDHEPILSLDGFVVKTYKVEHMAFNYPARAYSLRFEFEGKSIVFSGDCADCHGIRDATVSADLFVCDTSFPKTMTGNIHMNTLEIGDISQKSHVKKLILTHFYPQYKDIDLIGEIKEKFSGEISAGQDLTEIEI